MHVLHIFIEKREHVFAFRKEGDKQNMNIRFQLQPVLPHAGKSEEQYPGDTMQISFMTLEITISFQFFLLFMLWGFSYLGSLCSLKASMLWLVKLLHCHFLILVNRIL